MKRSFEQFERYCTSPEGQPNTGTFLLATNYDVLGLVAHYLDLDSLRNLFFCLLVEADIGHRILVLRSLIDTTKLRQRQRETLASMHTLLASQFPAVYQDCVLHHIKDIASEGDKTSLEWITESGDKALSNAKYKLERMRGLANNEYYAPLVFLSTETCDRCQCRLHTTCYWYNTRPLYLCTPCTGKDGAWPVVAVDALPADGYGWLTALRLKALCWIPNHVKASDFANANDIRLHSRHRCDVDTLSTPDKEYYFLKDAMPHFRWLPKK